MTIIKMECGTYVSTIVTVAANKPYVTGKQRIPTHSALDKKSIATSQHCLTAQVISIFDSH